MNSEEKKIEIDVTELVRAPSLEEELCMEKKLLEIKESKDLNEVKLCCMAATRQNYAQARFIGRTLERIAALEAKQISQEYKVKQPSKSWFKKALSYLLYN